MNAVALPAVAVSVAVAIAVVVLIALIPIAAVVLVLRLLFGGPSSTYRRSDPEEARMMQEIYRGLTKMEERIDALETIVLDRDNVPGVEH